MSVASNSLKLNTIYCLDTVASQGAFNSTGGRLSIEKTVRPCITNTKSGEARPNG